MSHLLYLMFRCDGDVMESLDLGGLVDLNSAHGALMEMDLFTRVGINVQRSSQQVFPSLFTYSFAVSVMD